MGYTAVFCPCYLALYWAVHYKGLCSFSSVFAARMSMRYHYLSPLPTRLQEQLDLQEQADEPPQEREKRVRNINNLYAFQLFCQHRFEESLQLFGKLGTGTAECQSPSLVGWCIILSHRQHQYYDATSQAIANISIVIIIISHHQHLYCDASSQAITNISIMMHHHKPKCHEHTHTKQNWVCCFQGQGHSEDSEKSKYDCSELLILGTADPFATKLSWIIQHHNLECLFYFLARSVERKNKQVVNCWGIFRSRRP